MLEESTYHDEQILQSTYVNIENILKSHTNLEKAAHLIFESSYNDMEVLGRDALDRFLDFIFFKVKSGYPYIPNLAYPSKRMLDHEIEKKVIELLNVHLIPDIILRVLKYFTRNIQNSDQNLYLAQLINNDALILPIYETFKQFKNDIKIKNPVKRTLNVKRIQQYSATTEERFSSPLDAACRLKYILEYIALKQNVSHLYTADNIKVSSPS